MEQCICNERTLVCASVSMYEMRTMTMQLAKIKNIIVQNSCDIGKTKVRETMHESGTKNQNNNNAVENPS